MPRLLHASLSTLRQLTHKKMQEKPCPSHLDAEQWEHYKQVVEKLSDRCNGTWSTRPRKPPNSCRRGCQMYVLIQNTYRNQAWGPVRIIHSTEVLLIEYALSCLLQPTASADWGYHLARQYAERYDSRYGTGLIPESAPLVEDIADFWCQYHLGKPLREWMAASKAS